MELREKLNSELKDLIFHGKNPNFLIGTSRYQKSKNDLQVKHILKALEVLYYYNEIKINII